MRAIVLNLLVSFIGGIGGAELAQWMRKRRKKVVVCKDYGPLPQSTIVYYERKAIELHCSGMSKEKAQAEAEKQVRLFPYNNTLTEDTKFPAVRWTAEERLK